MQDIHTFGGGSGGGGGAGRFFGGGDRRLRLHNHPNNQVLKCPRCESLNTKFCYYNNYNLSQPRHFCKNCRRYWTKGGVLRNVPVGGGCRKTKRSKQKSNAPPREASSNAQTSSSESSSLTAAAAATPTSAAKSVTEDGSAAPSNTTTNYSFPNTRFSFNATPNFDHNNQSAADVQIFPTDIGSYTSMMDSSPEMMAFAIADIPATAAAYERVQQGNNNQAPVGTTTAEDQFKMQDMGGGMSNNDGGLEAALDWGGEGGGSGGDQGLFDLTAAVDPAYWSQSDQWNDNDQSLNYLNQISPR